MSTADKALRFAATMLLLRDGGAGMEVFMVVRHHQIDFASGALVFPGGSIDPGDAAIAATPDRYFTTEPLDPLLTALRIAAIRETFEECGILLARARGSADLISAADAATLGAMHRAELRDGKIGFAEILEEGDLVLALDLLVPFAHWITPVGMPKRFDTHFFLAIAPQDQVGAHDGHESVDSIWVGPGEAVAGAKSGRFKLVFATERNLIKLGRHDSAAAAMTVAASTPVITVLPVVTPREGGRQLRIPDNAGYDGSVFEM